MLRQATQECIFCNKRCGLSSIQIIAGCLTNQPAVCSGKRIQYCDPGIDADGKEAVRDLMTKYGIPECPAIDMTQRRADSPAKIKLVPRLSQQVSGYRITTD